MADNKSVYVKGLYCPYCENKIYYCFGYDILEKNISTQNLNLCIGCPCENMFLLKIFGIDNYEAKPRLSYIYYNDVGEILVGQKSKPCLTFTIYSDQ